ncbi:60S ribosomal protein L4 [Myotis davidii]|uniref:60S ribosomal protein L4 n=1 Tax=Myotis davidii TaxID=225400 RepID=L5LYI2_MYODS|nr:60S ribosomal protein L4 [Myotis davidii]
MQEGSLRSPEEESTENPENHVEAKTLCKDHTLGHHSLPGQEPQLLVDRAAAAELEAKSDEKGIPGKKAVGLEKQKEPLVGKKAAGTKKPAAEKKAVEKKPTTEEGSLRHKLKFIYSIIVKSLWTANFE